MSKESTSRKPIRTELARRIEGRNLTYEEFAEYAETFARQNGEPGTLSVRHLQRLAAGHRPDGRPLGPVRPATARLLERIFNTDIGSLLGSPEPPMQTDAPDLPDLLNKTRHVDRGIIAELGRELATIRRLDREIGAVAAHDEAKNLENQVNRLRSFSLNPWLRAELGALQAELCTLAGWQALDLGQQMNAWDFYEKGKAAAADSENLPHLTHVRAEQAFILIDLGHKTDAVEILESLPHQGSSQRFRAWLFGALGEAYAATGQTTKCLNAFDSAAALRLDDGDEHEPYVSLDETHLARWRGHALAQVRRKEAIPVLTSALNLLDPTYVRARISLQTDLAQAHSQMGEFEPAQNYLNTAISTATRIGSVRQRTRLRSLQTRVHGSR
ncbi:tetratricopeptide repeat protein [Actinokineospora spheciospongiae]|uniref:hypothetical protein n=1 Tax=Actinokineospora spheciospongiae TaxID=909613 RepID=UPI001268A4EF|nr:hypothetical protein [Actinokineospora spheciospongiae]